MDTKFSLEKRGIDLAVFDLDGTLINQDSLFEQVRALYQLSKMDFFASLINFLFENRVSFKKLVFELNEKLDGNTLSMLNIEAKKIVKIEFNNYKRHSIKVIIATAAYERTAIKVLEKIKLVPDVVIATKDKDNLKGKSKLAALRPHTENLTWAYYGDSKSDIPLFKSASFGYKVAGNSLKEWV